MRITKFLGRILSQAKEQDLILNPKSNKNISWQEFKLFLWSFDVSSSYHCKALLTQMDFSCTTKVKGTLSLSILNLSRVDKFLPFDRQTESTLVSLYLFHHMLTTLINSDSSLSFQLTSLYFFIPRIWIFSVIFCVLFQTVKLEFPFSNDSDPYTSTKLSCPQTSSLPSFELLELWLRQNNNMTWCY